MEQKQAGDMIDIIDTRTEASQNGTTDENSSSTNDLRATKTELFGKLTNLSPSKEILNKNQLDRPANDVIKSNNQDKDQGNPKAVLAAASNTQIRSNAGKTPPTNQQQQQQFVLDEIKREPVMFTRSRNRWYTNEEVASILMNFSLHPEWQTNELQVRPKSGAVLLYSREKVRYRQDGYCWKKRKNGRTTREDHMKLKVQGIECIYGCYVHSAILPTFHRRCYWLLQNPDIVLVHYLNQPPEDQNKMMITFNSNLLEADTRRSWTNEEIIEEIGSVFGGISQIQHTLNINFPPNGILVPNSGAASQQQQQSHHRKQVPVKQSDKPETSQDVRSADSPDIRLLVPRREPSAEQSQQMFVGATEPSAVEHHCQPMQVSNDHCQHQEPSQAQQNADRRVLYDEDEIMTSMSQDDETSSNKVLEDCNDSDGSRLVAKTVGPREKAHRDRSARAASCDGSSLRQVARHHLVRPTSAESQHADDAISMTFDEPSDGCGERGNGNMVGNQFISQNSNNNNNQLVADGCVQNDGQQQSVGDVVGGAHCFGSETRGELPGEQIDQADGFDSGCHHLSIAANDSASGLGKTSETVGHCDYDNRMPVVNNEPADGRMEESLCSPVTQIYQKIVDDIETYALPMEPNQFGNNHHHHTHHHQISDLHQSTVQSMDMMPLANEAQMIDQMSCQESEPHVVSLKQFSSSDVDLATGSQTNLGELEMSASSKSKSQALCSMDLASCSDLFGSSLSRQGNQVLQGAAGERGVGGSVVDDDNLLLGDFNLATGVGHVTRDELEHHVADALTNVDDLRDLMMGMASPPPGSEQSHTHPLLVDTNSMDLFSFKQSIGSEHHELNDSDQLCHQQLDVKSSVSDTDACVSRLSPQIPVPRCNSTGNAMLESMGQYQAHQLICNSDSGLKMNEDQFLSGSGNEYSFSGLMNPVQSGKHNCGSSRYSFDQRSSSKNHLTSGASTSCSPSPSLPGSLQDNGRQVNTSYVLNGFGRSVASSHQQQAPAMKLPSSMPQRQRSEQQEASNSTVGSLLPKALSLDGYELSVLNADQRLASNNHLAGHNKFLIANQDQDLNRAQQPLSPQPTWSPGVVSNGWQRDSCQNGVLIKCDNHIGDSQQQIDIRQSQDNQQQQHQVSPLDRDKKLVSTIDNPFPILDYVPNWSNISGGAKVLIVGNWKDLLSSNLLVSDNDVNLNIDVDMDLNSINNRPNEFFALFDDKLVPATQIQDNVLRCYAPSHEQGFISLKVLLDDKIVSDSVLFEMRPSCDQQVNKSLKAGSVNSKDLARGLYSPCSCGRQSSSKPTSADLCEYFQASSKTRESFASLTLNDREQLELYEAAKVIQKAFRTYRGRKRQASELLGGESAGASDQKCSLKHGEPQQQRMMKLISCYNDSEMQAATMIQAHYRRYRQYAHYKQQQKLQQQNQLQLQLQLKLQLQGQNHSQNQNQNQSRRVVGTRGSNVLKHYKSHSLSEQQISSGSVHEPDLSSGMLVVDTLPLIINKATTSHVDRKRFKTTTLISCGSTRHHEVGQ